MFLTAPATNSTGGFTVTWTSVTTATRYELQQRKDSGSWNKIHDAAGRSKAVSGLANGSYGYRVRACNAGGCGGYSTVRTTVVTHPPASAPSLNAPGGNAASGFSFKWSAVATANRYEMYQSPNNGPWLLAHNGPETQRTVHAVDGQIRFRVRACNAGGCGPYSNIRTITVFNFPDPCPPGSGPCNDPLSDPGTDQ